MAVDIVGLVIGSAGGFEFFEGNGTLLLHDTYLVNICAGDILELTNKLLLEGFVKSVKGFLVSDNVVAKEFQGSSEIVFE